MKEFEFATGVRHWYATGMPLHNPLATGRGRDPIRERRRPASIRQEKLQQAPGNRPPQPDGPTQRHRSALAQWHTRRAGPTGPPSDPARPCPSGILDAPVANRQWQTAVCVRFASKRPRGIPSGILNLPQ